MDRKVRNSHADAPSKPPGSSPPPAPSPKIGPPKRVIEQPPSLGNEIRCPRCGSWDIRPSQQRRMLLDGLMWMLQKTPRRCRVCGRRFYIYADKKGKGPANDE